MVYHQKTMEIDLENNWLSLLLLAHLTMGSWTFLVYRHDKMSARKGRRRVSEMNLHLLELFFGWVGALIAQQVLRHKTKKASYQMVFWAIGALHLLGTVGWLVWMEAQ